MTDTVEHLWCTTLRPPDRNLPRDEGAALLCLRTDHFTSLNRLDGDDRKLEKLFQCFLIHQHKKAFNLCTKSSHLERKAQELALEFDQRDHQ